MLLIEQAIEENQNKPNEVEYYGLSDSDQNSQNDDEEPLNVNNHLDEQELPYKTQKTRLSKIWKVKKKKKSDKKIVALQKPCLIVNKDGNIGYEGAMKGKPIGGTNSTIKTGILGSIFADLNYGDMVIQYSNPFYRFQIGERLKIFEERAKFELLKSKKGKKMSREDLFNFTKKKEKILVDLSKLKVKMREELEANEE